MEMYVNDADQPIRRSPFSASTAAISLIGPTGVISPNPKEVYVSAEKYIHAISENSELPWSQPTPPQAISA